MPNRLLPPCRIGWPNASNATWARPSTGVPYANEYLPPQVIQACLLRKLKTDMIERLGEDCKVVVTVPAYFDEPRRKATTDAGQLAELSFIDIVNEPTAAALSFSETAGYLSPERHTLQKMNVLVYDLGGGHIRRHAAASCAG